MPPETRRRTDPPQLPGMPGPPGRMMGGPHGRPERARDTRAVLRRLWGYLRGQRAALTATLVVVVASSLLGILGPFLMARAIDRCILLRDLPGLARICAAMLALHAASSALVWVQSVVMAGISQRAVRDMRDHLFAKVQNLPLRYLDQRAHGDVMSRLTNDVDNISMVLSDSVAQIVSGVLSMVGIAAAMLLMNPVLALVSIGSVAGTSLLLNRWLSQRIRAGFRAQQAALGALNGLVEETISGQRVVKAHHREAAALERFEAANADLRRGATTAQCLVGTIGPLMNLINNFGLAVVAGVGGAMVVRGAATVGTVVGFINYVRQFGRPLNEIASLYSTIQAAMAGAERVFDLLDEQPESDAPDAIPLARTDGEVAFEDVSFAYEPGSPVLRHVNLRAGAGKVVALVGPTGAGKTTIVNLLSRFYDIEEGCIRLDGADIRTLRRDDLRRQLGIVLQDTYLFAGAVRENIRYGRLDATDDEVVAAARLANADHFIRRLPGGYDAPLSERASNLSQGQRQLLAIARAILADHSVLILDEATSSVDTRTERHIQEAMRRLMAGRTSFVIAHRLSTIRDADLIVVIDHGEIVESGTHAELLELGGTYHRLLAMQFRGVAGGPPAAGPAAGASPGSAPG